MPLFNGLSVCRCVCNIRRFYCLRELYEADFHKPGINRSGQVWANAWDAFRRMPSRGGRGRRAAVDLLVCVECGGIFSGCFFPFFLFERTRPAASMRPPCLIYLSTSNLYVTNWGQDLLTPIWAYGFFSPAGLPAYRLSCFLQICTVVVYTCKCILHIVCTYEVCFSH